MLRTCKDVTMRGERVVVRVDFNVPMRDGMVQDDTRVTAAVPTLRYIIEQGPRHVVLISHLGDPTRDADKAEGNAKKDGCPFDRHAFINGKHRLKPVADCLAKKLGVPVHFAPSCVGQREFIEGLPDGSVVLLGNVRFHPEETSGDAKVQEQFARELAQYGDIFVNDAFGTAHREHASTVVLPRLMRRRVAGLLIEREVRYLEPMVCNPKVPMVAVVGGAKVSSKIAVLESLLRTSTALIIGGGMAYTFLKAQGVGVGTSLVEDDFIDTARMLLQKAQSGGVSVVLPVDHVCASTFCADAQPVAVDDVHIPMHLMGMDVGPRTLEQYRAHLKGVSSVLWNGPVGVFEFDAFAHGTRVLAQLIAEATDAGATSVVGGGDSIAAVSKFGLASRMSHVSTGGGASLKLFEGKVLPGISCLET